MKMIIKRGEEILYQAQAYFGNGGLFSRGEEYRIYMEHNKKNGTDAIQVYKVNVHHELLVYAQVGKNLTISFDRD